MSTPTVGQNNLVSLPGIPIWSSLHHHWWILSVKPGVKPEHCRYGSKTKNKNQMNKQTKRLLYLQSDGSLIWDGISVEWMTLKVSWS